MANHCDHCDNNCDAGDLKKFLIRFAAGATLAAVLQTGGLIWWAAAITTRVGYMERTQQKVVDRLDRIPHYPLAVKPSE